MYTAQLNRFQYRRILPIHRTHTRTGVHNLDKSCTRRFCSRQSNACIRTHTKRTLSDNIVCVRVVFFVFRWIYSGKMLYNNFCAPTPTRFGEARRPCTAVRCTPRCVRISRMDFGLIYAPTLGSRNVLDRAEESETKRFNTSVVVGNKN
jgi:hypothetical protein